MKENHEGTRVLPGSSVRMRVATVLAFVAACLFAVGLFCSMAQATTADFYAVLHPDGELVFQVEASSAEDDVNFAGSVKGYTDSVRERPPWFSSAALVTSARFDKSFAAIQVKSLKFWFDGCSNMRMADLANLDASKSDSFRSMFRGCSSLEEIKGLEDLDTSSNTYLGSMFDGCSSLKHIDLSGFDTSHVGILCLMCRGCSSLESIVMTGPKWNTPALHLMVHVFEGCTSLKSIDLSGLNTSKVTSMTHDFDGCTSLEFVNLSTIDTSSMGNLTGLFDGCDNLKTVMLGDKFSFCGNGEERQCSLPQGNWKSSVTGVVYAHDQVPNNVAATYTLTTDPVGNPSQGSAQESDVTSVVNPGTATQDSTKPVTSLVVNVKTVNAKAVASAAKKAGANIALLETMTLGSKVKSIKKGTFKKCNKLKVLVVKTKKLTKKSIKGCLKGSKVKTIKVAVGSRAASKRLLKQYKKLFTAKVAGKKVQLAAL